MRPEKHQGGVLWQLEQNIKAKKLLVEAADDDIKRAQKRRGEAMDDLAEYELALNILTTEQSNEQPNQ